MIMDNDTKDIYTVNLHVGKDFLAAVEDKKMSVETLVSRQMLCDMTAHIENNISYLNSKRSMGERDAQFYYDGLRYRNLNYMITGTRGSGKTTFLNYLIKSLTREIDPFEENSVKHGTRNRYSARFYIKTERKQVTCRLLCRFDPSLPDVGRGSFLMMIVAALQSKVAELERNVALFRSEGNVRLADCSDVLKQLSKGIARLSQGKKQFENLSEYEVAHLRAENAELEDQLRVNFRRVVDLVCSLCGVDAFIISIDDADTHFAQCSVVMEDLRAYVTHPRLVVLFAGDRDLYLERVRELHFKEYDSEYHKTDIKGQGYRMDFVMHHANQYMIKQFPLENQYELRDINYLSRKMDPIRCRVHATINWDGNQYSLNHDLQSFVRCVFNTVINDSSADIDNYVSLFLSMPMRSVIQVLNAWALDEVWIDLIRLKKLNSEPLKFDIGADIDERKTRRVLRNLVRYALYAVLCNEIRTSDYDTERIDLDNPRDFYPLMLHLCQNINDLEHGYFLSGALARKHADKCMSLLLSLTSGSFFDDFNGFLTYFLFGPATVSLYAKALTQWQLTPDSGNESDLLLFKHDFSRYIHGSGWESPTRWARHVNMVWCHDPSFEAWHLGILRLRQADYVTQLSKTVYDFEKEQQNLHSAQKKHADIEKKLKKMTSAKNLFKKIQSLKAKEEENQKATQELRKKLQNLESKMKKMQEDDAVEKKELKSLERNITSINRKIENNERISAKNKLQIAQEQTNYQVAEDKLKSAHEREKELKICVEKESKILKSRFLRSLGLSIAMSHSEGRDNSYFISLFSLIAYILKIVQMCDFLTLNGATDENVKNELRKLLWKSYGIPSCGYPKWLISDSNNESRSNAAINFFDLHHEKIFDDAIQAMASKIYDWYQQVNKEFDEAKNIDLSPRVMGGLWRHLYYVLKEKSYCGELLNLKAEEFKVSAPKVGKKFNEILAACIKYFKSPKRSYERAVDEADTALSRVGIRYIAKFPLSYYCVAACTDYTNVLLTSAKGRSTAKRSHT